MNEKVKEKFNEKEKKRICNTVSNWKVIYEQQDYDARPSGLTKEVWDGLIRYWHYSHSIRTTALHFSDDEGWEQIFTDGPQNQETTTCRCTSTDG